MTWLKITRAIQTYYLQDAQDLYSSASMDQRQTADRDA
jgi:hypothetical protein